MLCCKPYYAHTIAVAKKRRETKKLLAKFKFTFMYPGLSSTVIISTIRKKISVLISPIQQMCQVICVLSMNNNIRRLYRNGINDLVDVFRMRSCSYVHFLLKCSKLYWQSLPGPKSQVTYLNSDGAGVSGNCYHLPIHVLLG